MSEPTKEARELAKDYVVMKCGYFYRPNSSGYTTLFEEAGRYTEAEAKKHVYPHDDPVTMHHISGFTPGVKELELRALREELRAAREALDTVLTGNEEGGLQYWIRKHDAMVNEVLRLRMSAACKGGDAV